MLFRSCPDHRSQADEFANSSDSVIDVSIRGPHCVRGDTSELPNNLLGPLQLQDDLLVGQGGEGSVRPGMHRELVTLHVFVLEDVRVGNGSRANDEESRLDVSILLKILQEILLYCVF